MQVAEMYRLQISEEEIRYTPSTSVFRASKPDEEADSIISETFIQYPLSDFPFRSSQFSDRVDDRGQTSNSV